MENENTCCFIGHRKINKTDRLAERVIREIEALITEKGVDTFFFGSKSEFNTLCHKAVTYLKGKYPHIKRVYVRAEFADIDDRYKKYLLKSYEETYYPEKICGAGRAVYIKRNQEMIDNSKYCVFYYDEKYAPPKTKSGTKIAYDYAVKKKREIINVCSSSGTPNHQ